MSLPCIYAFIFCGLKRFDHLVKSVSLALQPEGLCSYIHIRFKYFIAHVFVALRWFVLHDSLIAPGPQPGNSNFSFYSKMSLLSFFEIPCRDCVSEVTLAFFFIRPIRCLFFILNRLKPITSSQLEQIVAILTAAAHYHRAAFRANWLFIYVSACCHTLFTPLTETHSCFRIGSTCCHCCRTGSTVEQQVWMQADRRLAWPLMLGANIYISCHFVFVSATLCQSGE